MEIAPADLGPVVGHRAAKESFLSAVKTGHLHHGWLLRGPRGVGKARLALQFAALMLGDGTQSDLVVDADDKLGRLIVSGSHPDLRVIQLPVDEKGKRKTEIPVDAVRELAGFFSLSPAMGGWRVAIIDAVDELNRFGANALLKTLEEPPARAVLFLISHGERALPPTVRSRCRALSLGPLSPEETLEALRLASMPRARAEEVVKSAPGRPGRALALQGPDADAAADAVRTALRQLDRLEARTFQAAIAAASKSDIALAAAMDALRTSLQRRAMRESDPTTAGDWALAALDVMRLEGEARELNQDRGQTLAASLARVAQLIGG